MTRALNESSPTLSRRIRDALEADIFSGTLAPGQRIEEAELAARFGASRTPVREALQALQAGGLVDIAARQGAIVANPGLKRLIEMFELMAALEGFCARLAARRITFSELADLRAADSDCARAAAAEDTARFEAANDTFHAVITDAARNTELSDQTQALRARLTPFRRRVTATVGRMGRSDTQHRDIVEAISKGDGGTAEQAMRAHIASISDSFADLPTMPTVATLTGTLPREEDLPPAPILPHGSR